LCEQLISIIRGKAYVGKNESILSDKVGDCGRWYGGQDVHAYFLHDEHISWRVFANSVSVTFVEDFHLIWSGKYAESLAVLQLTNVQLFDFQTGRKRFQIDEIEVVYEMWGFKGQI